MLLFIIYFYWGFLSGLTLSLRLRNSSAVESGTHICRIIYHIYIICCILIYFSAVKLVTIKHAYSLFIEIHIKNMKLNTLNWISSQQKFILSIDIRITIFSIHISMIIIFCLLYLNLVWNFVFRHKYYTRNIRRFHFFAY